MKYPLNILPGILLVFPFFHTSMAGSLELVSDGKARAEMVVADQADIGVQAAAEQFVRIVERSTGARIPLLEEMHAGEAGADTVRIYVGPTRIAASEGLSPDTLPDEGYRIVAKGNAIFVLGREPTAPGGERVKSRPTRWALNSILEKQLGVRWLWPGDLGTHVPKHDRLAVAEMDVTYRAPLDIRDPWMMLRYQRDNTSAPELLRIEREAFDWAENLQAGRKQNYTPLGHAFRDWWTKYGEEHPDYFAEPPPGSADRQPSPKTERVKLRYANPAVIEQIAEEYKAAGAPNYWNVCTPDGRCFDTSEATRAWDIPLNQDPAIIWNWPPNGPEPRLTARHVEFWNRISSRLAEINPDVTLGAYAYSVYADPPPAERPLKARMLLGLVPLGFDEEQWEGWQKAGATRMILRPNWWLRGANGPVLPLHECARYVQFVWPRGLAGVIMDHLEGYWATKGPWYYLIMRMMTRPDLSADDIIGEYAGAFGAAGPKIREYLAYWEKVTEREALFREEGKFDDLIDGEQFKGVTMSARSAQSLPMLYPDDVLAPAAKLLEEARQAVGNGDAEALARVDFLQSGLDELRAFRDVMAAVISIREKTGLTKADFKERYARLMALRARIAPTHAIWEDAVNQADARQKVYDDLLTRPLPKTPGD